MEVQGFIRGTTSGCVINFVDSNGNKRGSLKKDTYLYKIISSLHKLVISNLSSDVIYGNRIEVVINNYGNKNTQKSCSIQTNFGEIVVSRFLRRADGTPSNPDHARLTIRLPVDESTEYQEIIIEESNEAYSV